ncbi:phage tail protein [Sulfuricurvum sp.]|uniref:phage tail protein n=1 Tax=Sulfuricurvum sp. TaxID=2025608 RepID=UPI003BAF8FBB
MSGTMAMLDTFIFSLSKTDFDHLSRTRNYNFAEIQKAQDHAGLQSLGKDVEEITISGSVTTLRSGIDPLEELYAIADKKDAVSFILGYGKVLGDFSITKISEDMELFLDDGRHVKVGFSIDLKKVYS